jgi:H+/gluconate symporter-like permease
MNIAVIYFSYLAISVALTVWVARTLHKNGRIFLVDAFHGNEQLADSVNHLLVVGFYLINVGYITLALKTAQPLATLREVIELESSKIGVVLLILGAMHMFNILVFAKMRRRAVEGRPQPPQSLVPSWPAPPAV